MSVEMSWALDTLTGARVEIDSDGPTGLACGCKCAGICGQPVEAVNRGKLPGTYRRTPHFRHTKGTTWCKGPTPHDLAVVIADERLNQDISDGVATMAEYDCDCRDRHTVNVLQLNGQAVRSVRESLLRNYASTERRIQPDIMLVAKRDGGVATIEVVYSHRPEDYVLAEGHPVLVIPISTEQDARALGDGLINAGRLYNYPCPDPICGMCGRRESAGCRICSECGDHSWNHIGSCAIHGNSYPLCKSCEECLELAKQKPSGAPPETQFDDPYWDSGPTPVYKYMLLHDSANCERKLNPGSKSCRCTMLVVTTTDSREWNALTPTEKLNLETWRSILPLA